MTELDTTAGRRLLDAIGKATTGTDRLAALSSFRQWAAANAEALLAAAEERDRLANVAITVAYSHSPRVVDGVWTCTQEPEPLTAEELADEMSEAWTTVERAIWPDGPASGHGSGVFAGLKARLIATLDAERAAHAADRERIAAAVAEVERLAETLRGIIRIPVQEFRSTAATEPPAQPAPVGELDVEALARALHAANVDCDYVRKFDRKSCLPGDGPHSILANSIAIEYDRDGLSTEGDCTFHRPYSPLCGKPRRDPIHPGPGERMGNGRHVFRHEPES
jgi:hypothetical protein